MTRQVIMFVPSFETGGVERNAVYVANGLVAENVSVHVMYCRKQPRWFDELAPAVQRLQVPRRCGAPWLHERLVDAINMMVYAPRAIRAIRRQGPTAILGFQSNVVAIVLARLCGVRVAVRLSNHPSAARREGSVLRWLAEAMKIVLYPWADIRIANSAALARAYEAHWPVEVIYNPIDAASVKQMALETVGEPLFLDKRRPIVISAGRLVRQKNFALALRALQIVGRTIPCDLVLLGEGEDRSSLERLADELGIRDRVHLLGKRSNVYKYFQRSDVFVLTSDYEGFPNALLEAAACGVPVVATDCPTGPREILMDGEGGRLVPPRDTEAMARAILEGLKDPGTAADRARVCRAGLRKYDVKIVRERYCDVVERLLPTT
jgi:glycosyltransferase involved in cell wall biosynthesis